MMAAGLYLSAIGCHDVEHLVRLLMSRHHASMCFIHGSGKTVILFSENQAVLVSIIKLADSVFMQCFICGLKQY